MDKYFEANAVLSIFSKRYMELKKGLLIRPSEMGVLNILAQTAGPHTSVKLAQMLGVSKPMITAHLSSLLEKGYITKEQSQEDKRAFYVLPTEKAMALVESAREDMERYLTRLTEALGQDDFAKFVALAQKANAVLQEEIEHGSER